VECAGLTALFILKSAIETTDGTDVTDGDENTEKAKLTRQVYSIPRPIFL
jgi:hypothetical protein